MFSYFKKIKIFGIVFLLLLAVFTLTGCKPKPRTFSKLEMTIELTNKFVEKSHISYTSYYESEDELVVCLREPFSMMAGSSYWSVTQYANACINANMLSGITSTMSENGEYSYFTFVKDLNGQSYTYLATCHKADEAFWLIQFATYTHKYSEYQSHFFKYANSIVFE